MTTKLQVHKLGKIPPKATLQEVICLISPTYELVETRDPEVYLLCQDREQTGVMVLCKTISKDIGVYLDSISNLCFGPEPLHKDIFTKIQHTMEELKHQQCIYILHSTENQLYHFQCVLPFDKTYVNWQCNR